MTNIFIINGYGVPKNILTDENYRFYLNLVFNKIYGFSINSHQAKQLIITSGGKTDCFKPYARTEAEEMLKLFKKLCARPLLKNKTKNWQLLAENKSLSTLENLLFVKKIIDRKKINKANVYLFCEATREVRIKTLTKKIFTKNFKCQILSIDFDVSENRYLNPEFINKKEKAEIKHSLWALQSPTNLKKHHQAFQEKVNYFRKEGKNHPNILKEWWEKKLKELE